MTDKELMDRRNSSPGQIRLTADGLDDHTEIHLNYHHSGEKQKKGRRHHNKSKCLTSFDSWKKIQERKKWLALKWQQQDERIQQQFEQIRQQHQISSSPSSQSNDSFYLNNFTNDELSLAPLDTFLTAEVIPLSPATLEKKQQGYMAPHETDPQQQQQESMQNNKKMRQNDLIGVNKYISSGSTIISKSLWGKQRQREEEQLQQLFEGKITKFRHHKNHANSSTRMKLVSRKNANRYIKEEIIKQQQAVIEKQIKEERERMRIEKGKESYLQRQRVLEERQPHIILNHQSSGSSTISSLTAENSLKYLYKRRKEDKERYDAANTNTILPAQTPKNFTLNAHLSSHKCALCEKGKVTYIAMPCMHYSFCEECVEALQTKNATQCPICRGKNTTFTKVY